MFPVCFELKKHLRIIPENSEHTKQFFRGFEASPWRKTALKYSKQFPQGRDLPDDFFEGKVRP